MDQWQQTAETTCRGAHTAMKNNEDLSKHATDNTQTKAVATSKSLGRFDTVPNGTSLAWIARGHVVQKARDGITGIADRVYSPGHELSAQHALISPHLRLRHLWGPVLWIKSRTSIKTLLRGQSRNVQQIPPGRRAAVSSEKAAVRELVIASSRWVEFWDGTMMPRLSGALRVSFPSVRDGIEFAHASVGVVKTCASRGVHMMIHHLPLPLIILVCPCCDRSNGEWLFRFPNPISDEVRCTDSSGGVGSIVVTARSCNGRMSKVWCVKNKVVILVVRVKAPARVY